MKVTPQQFQDFQEVIREDVPAFEVAYKTESLLMGILGFLLYPLNSEYMTGYVTTWGNTVYFPNRSYVFEDFTRAFRILAHEYVHLVDSKKHGFFGYKLTYVFPQVLVLLPLMVYALLGSVGPLFMVLGGYLAGCYAARHKAYLFWVVLVPAIIVALVCGWVWSGWWVLLIPGSFIFLALPSPGRTRWELRGYTMSLATIYWLSGKDPRRQYFDYISRQFTGSSYLYMCRDEEKVRNSLHKAYERVLCGSLQAEHPYGKVHDVIRQQHVR